MKRSKQHISFLHVY